jgi:hypothetical protein
MKGEGIVVSRIPRIRRLSCRLVGLPGALRAAGEAAPAALAIQAVGPA